MRGERRPRRGTYWVLSLRTSLTSPSCARQPHHVLGLGAGTDALRGETGHVGVGRQQGGDLIEGGLVAGEQCLLRIGERRRHQGGEGVDELVVGLGGKVGEDRIMLLALPLYVNFYVVTRKLGGGSVFTCRHKAATAGSHGLNSRIRPEAVNP